MVERSPSLSVVIPVYNSAGILPALIRRLESVLRAAADEFELILVDDNSPDESWRVIGELSAENEFVRGVRMMRNYGQHNAILCGIRRARFDVVVTMDDDLQHPPEEIPKLLDELSRGFDVVYGSPETEQHGFLRDLASVITKFALQRAMGSTTARKSTQTSPSDTCRLASATARRTSGLRSPTSLAIDWVKY